MSSYSPLVFFASTFASSKELVRAEGPIGKHLQSAVVRCRAGTTPVLENLATTSDEQLLKADVPIKNRSQASSS